MLRDGRVVETLELGADPVVVGRDESADLVLDDPSVSRRHLRLVPTDGGHRIEDLKTENGTFVDGIREWSRQLESDATIQLGEVVLLYRLRPSGSHKVLVPRTPSADAILLEGDDLPSTHGLAPRDLRRLQAEMRIQTRPHLEVSPRSEAAFGGDRLFPLAHEVTAIGYGPVAVSLAKRSKKSVLAEIHRDAEGFELRSRGLFSKVKLNGKKCTKARLRPGNTIEVDGRSFAFRPGLPDP